MPATSFHAKSLAEIRAFDIESAARFVQNSLEKRRVRLSPPARGSLRANRRRPREKREKKKEELMSIIETAEYLAAKLRQGRGKSASGSQPRNWRKTVANLQACIPRSQQCVILLKRGGTRDIGTLVGEVQMENETIIWRTLRRDRWVHGNGVTEHPRVIDAASAVNRVLLENPCKAA